MGMAKQIGVHLGTAGGASNAVERAREIGANTFQFFSSSPRMWHAPKVDPKQAERMRTLRAALDVGPLVIHTSYLVNVCSQTDDVREKSVAAFRGEIERALTFGAEYLVLHPGSWKGLTRDEGLKLAAESITRAIDGLPWQGTGFHILIENTAGAEFSLGGSFEQVSRQTELVGKTVGFEAVRVWHCNDAKAARGSKLDRHEHIGQGTMGVEPFRRLLNDARFAHAAFIAETPVDEPGDEERNVRVLKSLIESA
jgi:deoxyribonuclease-4